MDGVWDEQVRQRAYEIWMNAGRIEGRAHEHWAAAEGDVRARETIAAAPSKTAKAVGAAEFKGDKAASAKPATLKAAKDKSARGESVTGKPVTGKSARPAVKAGRRAKPGLDTGLSPA